jgi:class 3 adenylate cyclase
LRRALIDPAIREHGAKVVQTGGDSLLATFDSIDGAVRCAVKGSGTRDRLQRFSTAGEAWMA